MNRPVREPLPSHERITGRFVLRPFRRRDTDALYRAVRSSRTELAEFLPWASGEYSRATAAGFIRESIHSWRESKAYDFAIRRPETPRRHIGNVSIWHLSRTYRSGEIGYWIRTEDTGLGIATEVAGSALEIGFEELGLHRVILRIALGNTPSERVARKLGFIREGILREEIRVGNRWMDHSLWGLLDHEFRHTRPRG